MSTSGSFNTSGYDGRYLVFSWSLKSQSIEYNQSVISWTLKGAGGSSNTWYMAGPFKCVINGTTVYQSSERIKLYTGTVVASGDFTIGHEWDGSKSFSAYAEGAIYTFAVNCSGSGNWALPTIPRTSQPSLNTWPNNSPDFNIGDTITVHMNRKSSSFTHTVVLMFGSYRYTIGTGVKDNISLNTDRIATNLYEQIPNSVTGTGEITVTTYSGGTVIGTASCAIIAHVVDSNPDFLVSYRDQAPHTPDITGDNQVIIRNQSDLRIEITGAEAKNSATLKSAYAVVNGNKYSISLTSESGHISCGNVNSSADLTVPVTVTDSRGISTTKNIKVTVWDWAPPTAIINVWRESNYYSNCFINVNASYSSLQNLNTINIIFKWKKKSETSYTNAQDIYDNVETKFTADNQYDWDIEVDLSDKFATTTYTTSLHKGIPIFGVDVAKYSIGVNCLPKYSNSFEVNGVCISGQVLYNSESGTAGTVTLSDSAENYTYLEIFYRSSGDNACGSVKVFSPNGKLVHLGTIHYIADYDYAKYALVSVSGSMIKFTQNYQITIKNNGSSYSAENAIFITLVFGY